MRASVPAFRRFLSSPALSTPVHLAVLALCGADVAYAQAQAPAATDGAGAPVQEVVVTATKRSTSLQRTPIAVTKLDAAALDDAHVQTIADIVNLVPSFAATTQGDHGVITMTLRGIGNDSAKTEYADPEVALFIDGVYAPRAEGAAALLFDLESIEVLRGPQGTLWGRNSTVGAVNMQTAKPVLKQRFGNVEAGLGDYNRIGLRGAFNAPLSDTMALRISFAKEMHDGYVNYQAPPYPSLSSQRAAVAAYNTANNSNVPFQEINQNLFVQGGPKYGAQDQTGVRLSLLVQPHSGLRWDLSYEKFLDRGMPNMNLMQAPRPGQDHWSALIDTAGYLVRDTNTIRSRVEYTVNDQMALAYTFGYSQFKGKGDFDQDGGASVPTSFTTGATYQEDRTNHSKYTNYSHELSLQSTGKQQVDWILGAYYAAEDNSIRFDIPIMNGTQQGTVGWQGSFIQPKETVDSKALFGQATFNVSEQLHLTGGLRYTSDDRKNIGGTGNGWAYDPAKTQAPISINTDPFNPASNFSTFGHNDGHYSGSKTTWLVRGSYDVSKDMMVYGSISTGYKSGGLQDGGLHYGPETLTNYEIGTKNTFMNGAVKFNNALFYEDFSGYQFSAPITNPDGSHTLATSNAEGAKVSGFESELAANLTKNDRLQVSLAFLKTKLGYLHAGSNDYALPACPDPGISNCLDVTGHELPHAPSFAAQVQYWHTFRMDDGATLTPRISLHYETSSWLSVFNLGAGDQQGSYSRTDLGLRYVAPKSWYVDAYVRNISDVKVKTNAQNSFGGVWQSQYLPPRTIGFNAGMDF